MASLAQPVTDPGEALRERFARHGQAHVFRFWGTLGPAARERLAAQAEALDLAALERALAEARARPAPAAAELAPPPALRLPEAGGDAAERARAREAGEALLAEGCAAVLVLAGGQGTRLGFDGPKGAFPIGPASGRTLLGLCAEKLRRLARRYGRAPLWVVGTSPWTDAPLRALLRRERAFGLDPERVLLAPQGAMPCVDREGRLLLEAPDRIATSPDGHGGALPALAASGALERMRAEGATALFSAQVDNPLARLADPALLGLLPLRGAEMASKAVARRAPDERVGLLAREAGGRLRVVEYTELEEPLASRRALDGGLAFWAGSIGIHALDRAFAERVAARAEVLLPFHASPKRIAHLDAEGRLRRPAAPNGLKLERFVFDALPAARGAAVLEARREEEYSPVKNASGAESPATARRDLEACYRRWLEAGGARLPPEGAPLELDEARIDGAEDVRAGLRPGGALPPEVLRTRAGGSE